MLSRRTLQQPSLAHAAQDAATEPAKRAKQGQMDEEDEEDFAEELYWSDS